MLTNYLFYWYCIFLYLIISFFLSLVFLVLSYLFIFQNNIRYKITEYECGFEAFENARQQFDVKFYIVCMLFIIFDLEIVFLIPISLTINFIGLFGLLILFFFFFLLTLGFIYEWLKNALTWPRLPLI